MFTRSKTEISVIMSAMKKLMWKKRVMMRQRKWSIPTKEAVAFPSFLNVPRLLYYVYILLLIDVVNSLVLSITVIFFFSPYFTPAVVMSKLFRYLEWGLNSFVSSFWSGNIGQYADRISGRWSVKSFLSFLHLLGQMCKWLFLVCRTESLCSPPWVM